MLLTKVRNHPSVFLNYYMSTLLLPSAVSPFYKAIPVRLKGLLKNHLKNNQKKSRLCIISKNICIFALSYETPENLRKTMMLYNVNKKEFVYKNNVK